MRAPCTDREFRRQLRRYVKCWYAKLTTNGRRLAIGLTWVIRKCKLGPGGGPDCGDGNEMTPDVAEVGNTNLIDGAAHLSSAEVTDAL